MIDSGQSRICATAPTGAGKALMLSMAIHEAVSRGWRVSLYTHRSVLIPQLSGVLTNQGISHGVRASGYKTALNEPVQISMWQTEAARCLSKNPQWNLHGAHLVLIDEAHGYTAATTQKIVDQHVNTGASVVGFTATPVDLWHMFDQLVVITNNSELRSIGAHLPCLEYAPDEPDAQGIRRTKVGEFVEGDVVKRIMVPTVFGRIRHHYHLHNPNQLPSILFGPNVEGSKYFCEDFCHNGIPAAHIDAKQIYYGFDSKSGNPKIEASSNKNREALFDRVRNGEIKVLCNRFVLTEGLDIPELFLCIMATMFGSVKMYLQAAGRLLRSHPSMEHVCLKRDTPVLTNRGEVPIQDVRLDDLVWDGVEFVSHRGPRCMGIKKVISWDGITATPDHKVLTSNGWKSIAAAKANQERIVRASIGGVPERVLDDSNPYNSRSWPKVGSNGKVQPVQSGVNGPVPQNGAEDSSWMQEMHAALQRELSGMDLPSSTEAVLAMHETRQHCILPLRRTGDKVQLPVDLGCHTVDSREPGYSAGSRPTTGSSQQQRALRARKPEVVHTTGANGESKAGQQGKTGALAEGDSNIPNGVPRSAIQRQDSPIAPDKWEDGSGNCNAMEGVVTDQALSDTAEVWDILDCGPRNRFTANGRVVSNCITDHGGNIWRHGSVNSDQAWEIGDTSKKIFKEREARAEAGEEILGITCPKCHYVRLSGPTCHQCGHAHHHNSRMVVQQDGTLKRQDGPAIKKKHQRPEGIKAWQEAFWPSYKSKRPHSMTWNQLWATFKYNNAHLFPHISQDQHGRKRLAIVDPVTKSVQPLPLHPNLDEKFLWSLKVRDVPVQQLLK